MYKRLCIRNVFKVEWKRLFKVTSNKSRFAQEKHGPLNLITKLFFSHLKILSSSFPFLIKFLLSVLSVSLPSQNRNVLKSISRYDTFLILFLLNSKKRKRKKNYSTKRLPILFSNELKNWSILFNTRYIRSKEKILL